LGLLKKQVAINRIFGRLPLVFNHTSKTEVTQNE